MISPCPKPRKRRKKPRFHARRNPEYLEWIRQQPCIIMGLDTCRYWSVSRPHVEPAHLKTRGSGGDDVGNVVPLCPKHHDEQEGRTAEFERRHGVDLRAVAQGLADRYREERGTT